MISTITPMSAPPEMPVPHLFRCPISLDLFTDPVTLCTGHTYDRPFIQKWISSGHLTCPVTMLTLHDLSMVPNHTLSHLIHQWLRRTGQTPPPPAAHPHHDHYLASLKETLLSREPPWEKKLLALKQLKNLSLEITGKEIENDSLIRFRFFELLLDLAFSERRLEAVELALTVAVKIMRFSDLGCLRMLKEESKLEILLELLEKGTSMIKVTVCGLLEAVLSCREFEDLSGVIRSSGEIQRSVINLVFLDDEYDDVDNAEVAQAGVKVVLALCTSGSVEKLVELGAVRGLVRYIMRALRMEKAPAVGAAAAALEALVAAEGGREALLGEEDGVRALVKMVFRVRDEEGSESAVNGLMGLCGGSVAAREAAVKAGVVTQLLLVLQSQGGGRVKSRGRMLLKLLRGMWVKDP